MKGLKKFFDLNSMALTSALLGAILIAVEAVPLFDGIPPVAITIAQAIAFAMMFFGVYNAAKASQASLINRFREFAMSKYGGTLLVGLVTWFSQNVTPDPNAPGGLVIIVKSISAVMTVLLGPAVLRELVVKARLNQNPLAPELQEKYKAYAE